MKNKTPVRLYWIIAIVTLMALAIPTRLGQATPSKIAVSAQIETVAPKPKLETIPMPESKGFKPIVKLRQELIPVCACESTGKVTGTPRQFNKDGTVVTGKINKLDKGMCQINLHYHESTAKKMGLDLLTEQGNIQYANHLFQTQGYAPWKASSACWGTGFGTSSIMY